MEVISGPKDQFHGVEAVFKDPFGNWFSLGQPKLGFVYQQMHVLWRDYVAEHLEPEVLSNSFQFGFEGRGGLDSYGMKIQTPAPSRAWRGQLRELHIQGAGRAARPIWL